MKKIAILCHGSHVCAGEIPQLLDDLRLPYKLFHSPSGELPGPVEDYRGVIVMGGPMAVYDSDKLPWMLSEMRWVEEALDAGLPAFGICLGCQMLAALHDGEVVHGEKGMVVGFNPITCVEDDPVLTTELCGENVFFWHGDTYTLGEKVTRLARGRIYFEQAAKFRPNVYGVQFHPEANMETIKRWYERDVGHDPRVPKGVPSLAQSTHIAEEQLPKVHRWLEGVLGRLFKNTAST